MVGIVTASRSNYKTAFIVSAIEVTLVRRGMNVNVFQLTVIHNAGRHVVDNLEDLAALVSKSMSSVIILIRLISKIKYTAYPYSVIETKAVLKSSAYSSMLDCRNFRRIITARHSSIYK